MMALVLLALAEPPRGAQDPYAPGGATPLSLGASVGALLARRSCGSGSHRS